MLKQTVIALASLAAIEIKFTIFFACLEQHRLWRKRFWLLYSDGICWGKALAKNVFDTYGWTLEAVMRREHN